MTGFCEGEAAFTFSRTTGKHQVWTTPRFSIRQRFDGRDVLEAVKEAIGVGVIYDCAARGRTQPNAYYVVCAKDELPIVVKHFQSFPLRGEQKNKIFNIWREMVRIYTLRGYGYDLAEMDRLARLLTVMQLRPRGFKRRKNNLFTK